MHERAPSSELLVADSFRVRPNPLHGAAEVRGWSLHVARFRASVLASMSPTLTSTEIDTFLKTSARRISHWVHTQGEGFPRLELRRSEEGAPELALSLRDRPALTQTIEMRVATGVRLTNPEVKGPNIARLADLTRKLSAEALLLDPAGHVLEGATTSLIWWDPDSGRGFIAGDPRETPFHGRVHSVTEQLLRTLIGNLEPALISPTELVRHETWAVNALHGIRPVTRIDETDLPIPEPTRLHRIMQALDRSWELLSDDPQPGT